MKKSTTLVVLALASAAALAATSGGGEDDGDVKEPDEPGPMPGEDDDDDGPHEPGEPAIDPDAPTVPIPTPDPMWPENEPAPQPENEPSPTMPKNVVQLESLDDFREWGVLGAVEPDGSVGAKRRVVMLGYDIGWVGRPIALARLSQLAAANPSVTFVLFTFQRSRELTDQPNVPLGYVATSVGPDGRARPDAFVGKKKVLGPLSPGVFAELVRWAKDGPKTTDTELRLFESPSGVPYVVEVEQEKSGFVFVWRWKVWREVLGEDDAVVKTDTKPSKLQAIDAARTFIAHVGDEGQAGGQGLGLAG